MNWPDLLALDLRLVGLLLVGLGIAHGFFDRHFGWRQELSKVSLFTRQVFYVHHFFIALTVAMMGLLAILIPRTLIQGNVLSVTLDVGLSLFWAIRLYCQLFVYREELWKGRQFETAVHLCFAAFWSYCALSFGLAALIAWQQLR
jgi:hypothetical protein